MLQLFILCEVLLMTNGAPLSIRYFFFLFVHLVKLNLIITFNFSLCRSIYRALCHHIGLRIGNSSIVLSVGTLRRRGQVVIDHHLLRCVLLGYTVPNCCGLNRLCRVCIDRVRI